MAMRIRRATVADIPLLRQLAERIWRECYPAIISVEQIEFMLGWMYSEAQLAGEIERGIAWEILELEAQPIGFLSYQLEDDRRVKLNKLYVLPEQQGRGYGRAALAHVMQRAVELRASAVWMQVNKRNFGAVAAYQKAGFHIAREAVFDIGHGFVMDDYLMEKAVPAREEMGCQPVVR